MAISTSPQGKLIGYVSVEVGKARVRLPVHALEFESDGVSSPGGLVAEGDKMGILVDANATESERQAQVSRATKEAVGLLSRRFLN